MYGCTCVCVCVKVGESGRGVAGISPLLTITRLHNTMSAAGLMRRYDVLNVTAYSCMFPLYPNKSVWSSSAHSLQDSPAIPRLLHQKDGLWQVPCWSSTAHENIGTARSKFVFLPSLNERKVPDSINILYFLKVCSFLVQLMVVSFSMSDKYLSQ